MDLNLDDLTHHQTHIHRMDTQSVREAGEEADDDDGGNNGTGGCAMNAINANSNDCDQANDDDDDAFVASCTDASFVLNPHHTNNPSRRLYINKLYQPMNGGGQIGSLVDEQDDELMLYQELESLESTVLKSVSGRRRRRLTKILEDDDDEICFDDCDESSDEEDIDRDSDNVRQTDLFADHCSSSDKLHLATIIDAFGSDAFPPSPLSESPPRHFHPDDHHHHHHHGHQVDRSLPADESDLTPPPPPTTTTAIAETTTTTICNTQADQLLIIDSSESIDHRHRHQQQEQPATEQLHLQLGDDQHQHHQLEHEMNFETPPISTYSSESLSGTDCMLMMNHSRSSPSQGSQTPGSSCNNGSEAGLDGGPENNKYRRRTANARERIRMREINQAFEKLKRVVPVELIQQHHQQQQQQSATNNGSAAAANNIDDEWSTDGGGGGGGGGSNCRSGNKSVKLTKITTLRLAKSYITILTDLLKEPLASSGSSSPITAVGGDNETIVANKLRTSSSSLELELTVDSSTSTTAATNGQLVKIPPSNLFNSKRKQTTTAATATAATAAAADSRRRAYKRRQPPSAVSNKSTCQQVTTKKRPLEESSKSKTATPKITQTSPSSDETNYCTKADTDLKQQIVSSTTTTTTCNAIALNQAPQHLHLQQHQQPIAYSSTATYSEAPHAAPMGTIQLQPAARHHPIIIAAANNMIGRCLLQTNNGYISIAPQNHTASATANANQPLRTFVTPVAVAFFGLPAGSAATSAAPSGWISQQPAAITQSQFLTAAPSQQQQHHHHQQHQQQHHQQIQLQPAPQQQTQQQQQPTTTASPIPKSQPAPVPVKQQLTTVKQQQQQQQPAMRTYRFHNYDGRSLYANNNQDSKHNQQQQQQQRQRTTTTN